MKSVIKFVKKNCSHLTAPCFWILFSLCYLITDWVISLYEHLKLPTKDVSLLNDNPRNFPGGSDGKASAYNAGDLGSITGSGRSPGEGSGTPLQYSPGKSHGWRNLVGYSPWGRKESDTTEQLHFHFQPKKRWHSGFFTIYNFVVKSIKYSYRKQSS